MTTEKEELLRQIRELEKKRDILRSQIKHQQYGLVWLDVPEAFDEESENKIPILEEVTDNAICHDDGKPTHILIEGDNYHSLKCLNYTHKGKVDVIYIDPPYNTGNDGFTYKDKRVMDKDPEGKELPKNHPLRHSTWLSFMDKRLRLAKDLLSDKGVIFISIDDNEDAALKLLCDSIFSRENKVADIIWQSRKSVSNDTFISNNHNYTLVYFKDSKKWNKGDLNMPASLDKFENPDNDPRGAWVADPFDAPEIRPNLTYPIINPNTGKFYLPPEGRHWRTTEEEYKKMLADGRIVFGKKGLTKPQLKRYIYEAESKGQTPISIWNDIETTTDGTKLLDSILGKNKFSNPKPIGLLNRILTIASKSDSVILDFFAGSGTTLHATMKQNEQDGGKRQCILCQINEGDICTDVTYERNKRVMNGYTDSKGNEIEGLGNSLKYYRTAFVGKNNPQQATDDDKVALAKKAGCLLALAENTLYERKSTDFYQFYDDGQGHSTAIYFQEDYSAYTEFLQEVKNIDGKRTVYVFSWGTGEEFSEDFEGMKDVSLKGIPQPILDIYKSLNQ